VQWVQIDEPILGLDLPGAGRWPSSAPTGSCRQRRHLDLLATYFSPLDNLPLACRLPVAGLHVDAVRAGPELQAVLAALPPERELSIGILDGRNIWRTDLDAALAKLRPALAQRRGRCGSRRRARCCMCR
jgi:5-methyltetrahydropteroyltriglutamate--homocysteine methyltransferase